MSYRFLIFVLNWLQPPNPPLEFAPFGGWDAAKARRPSASR